MANQQGDKILIRNHLDQCLPKEATRTSGDFYRLLGSGSLDKESFVPRVHMPGRKSPDTCSENAVSLCPTVESVKRKKKQFNFFSDKPVAKVSIGTHEDHGVMKVDNESHVNWWHGINFNPVLISKIFDGASNG